jgi:hypothetical protein
MTCICCCTNRPQDGRFCIAEDYTQIVITLGGLAAPGFLPPGACDCLDGLVIVADFVNETQEFESGACVPPGGVGRVSVLPTLGGFNPDFCRHISPGFGGSVDFSFSPGGEWLQAASFSAYLKNAQDELQDTTSGVLSKPNEECGAFSDRIGRLVLTADGPALSACLPTFDGTWELQ